MLLGKQCLPLLAELTLRHDIASFCICHKRLFHTLEKTVLRLKMPQERRLRKQAQTPSCWKQKQYEMGVGDRINILLTHSPPALITMQALSASVESLYYFQVSPIVSHCDKVQDNLTQWWITPDIEFSHGCQMISVGCVTWNATRLKPCCTSEHKKEFGINSTDSGHKHGSLEGCLRFLLPRKSLHFYPVWMKSEQDLLKCLACKPGRYVVWVSKSNLCMVGFVLCIFLKILCSRCNAYQSIGDFILIVSLAHSSVQLQFLFPAWQSYLASSLFSLWVR